MLTLDALQGCPLGECGHLPPVTERTKFTLACKVSLEDPHHSHQGTDVSLLHLIVVLLSFYPLLITFKNCIKMVGFAKQAGKRFVVIQYLL